MHVCFRYFAPGQLVASNTLVMGKYLNNFRYFAPGQLLRLFGSRLNKVHLWSSCFAVFIRQLYCVDFSANDMTDASMDALVEMLFAVQ